MGSAEGSRMRNFIVHTVHLIKSRRMEGHVVRMGKARSAFKILTDKSAEKRPLERPRRRWEDNIRMDLKEMRINTRNWIDLAHHRD